MRLLKCIVAGGLLLSAGQAYAEDDPATEIRALKAKLKQLEQRVDDQGRKERQIEAQTRTLPPVAAYKAAPSAPVPYGKVCYKDVTLTFGGWVDLTASTGRAISPPTPARSTTSFRFRRRRTTTRRNCVSRRGRAASRFWPRAMSAPTRISRAMVKSTSRARRRPPIRSRPTPSTRACGSSVLRSTAPISAFMCSPANPGR